MKQLGPVCGVESTAAIGVRKRRRRCELCEVWTAVMIWGLGAGGDVRSQISLGREDSTPRPTVLVGDHMLRA